MKTKYTNGTQQQKRIRLESGDTVYLRHGESYETSKKVEYVEEGLTVSEAGKTRKKTVKQTDK